MTLVTTFLCGFEGASEYLESLVVAYKMSGLVVKLRNKSLTITPLYYILSTRSEGYEASSNLVSGVIGVLAIFCEVCESYFLMIMQIYFI